MQMVGTVGLGKVPSRRPSMDVACCLLPYVAEPKFASTLSLQLARNQGDCPCPRANRYTPNGPQPSLPATNSTEGLGLFSWIDHCHMLTDFRLEKVMCC